MYFASGTPAQIQNDFIANATTYFNGSLVPSPYFSGTYSLTISGEKSPPIAPVSSPIADGTAVDRCEAYGFAWGEEAERQDNLRFIANALNLVTPQTDCAQAFEDVVSTITLKSIIFPPGN